MTKVINNLSEISNQYKALFVDLWGCLHDGYKPFLEAVHALQTYRANGGLVILVTNAPRHSSSVEQQIKKIGIEMVIAECDSHVRRLCSTCNVLRGRGKKSILYRSAT